MVRLIIPDGASWTQTIGGQPVTLTGPFEIVLEDADLGTGAVTSGEYLRVGSTWEQTLPYLREELSISFPVSITLGVLIALTWLRKHL